MANKNLERGLAKKLYCVAILLCSSLVGGCGTGSADVLVSGEVIFLDKPVTEGVLQLVPLGETPGRGAAATIKGGSYTFSREKGLTQGEYRVVITATRETGKKYRNPEQFPGEPAMIQETVQYIPASYNVQSKLQVNLETGENKHDFQLTDK